MRLFYSLFFLLCFPLFSNGQQAPFNIQLVYQWKDTTLTPAVPYGNTYNEIWGIKQNGKEYAIIGTTAGTHFFDLSDVHNIHQVAFVAGRYQGQNVIHRDYHDYNGYLYAVCDEGNSSLQIMDLQYLPDSVPVVYDESNLINISHNIYIDTAKGRLYSCRGPVKIFDIKINPVLPSLIYTLPMPDFAHDIFVRGDTAYINASDHGLMIFELSDPSQENLLAEVTQYHDQGYNHSGWLNTKGDIYALADETWGKSVKIFNVSDLNNIELESSVFSNVDANSIVHNLMINGHYLYLAHYYDGLYIYDISDPKNPLLTGSYDTSIRPHTTSYEGAWGVYSFLESGLILVSDMQEGLFVFDASLATSDQMIASKEFTDAIGLLSNPSNTIVFNKTLKHDDELTLYNMQSELIYFGHSAQKLNQVAKNNPAGIYLIQVKTGHTTQSFKWIKTEL